MVVRDQADGPGVGICPEGAFRRGDIHRHRVDPPPPGLCYHIRRAAPVGEHGQGRLAAEEQVPAGIFIHADAVGGDQAFAVEPAHEAQILLRPVRDLIEVDLPVLQVIFPAPRGCQAVQTEQASEAAARRTAVNGQRDFTLFRQGQQEAVDAFLCIGDLAEPRIPELSHIRHQHGLRPLLSGL